MCYQLLNAWCFTCHALKLQSTTWRLSGERIILLIIQLWNWTEQLLSLAQHKKMWPDLFCPKQTLIPQAQSSVQLNNLNRHMYNHPKVWWSSLASDPCLSSIPIYHLPRRLHGRHYDGRWDPNLVLSFWAGSSSQNINVDRGTLLFIHYGMQGMFPSLDAHNFQNQCFRKVI